MLHCGRLTKMRFEIRGRKQEALPLNVTLKDTNSRTYIYKGKEMNGRSLFTIRKRLIFIRIYRDFVNST